MNPPPPNHSVQSQQYERYMGRWSRLIANQFVAWLDAPARQSWLDMGCGTGALSFAIAECAAPRHICGVDPDPAYIAYASERAPRHCVFQTGDSPGAANENR